MDDNRDRSLYNLNKFLAITR